MADYQWPGHYPAHYTELERAAAANCACQTTTTPPVRCASHQMLDNPRLLETLAFVKEEVARYQEREWMRQPT